MRAYPPLVTAFGFMGTVLVVRAVIGGARMKALDWRFAVGVGCLWIAVGLVLYALAPVEQEGE